MKKLIITSAIAISGLIYNTANAQIRLHLGIHFGPRPVIYAPARVVVAEPVQTQYCEPANYNGDEDYYYLPEVDAYYSVPEQCYYYNDGGQWVSAAYLPGAYHDFNWQNTRRFEVRAPRPFLHANYYRSRYNGVAFNGNWNRGYNHNYANNQYRNDNRGWANNNHQFDQNRDQHFNNDRNRNDQHVQQNHNFDRMSAQQHFAQNNPQRGGRDGGNNHREGKF